MAFLCCYALFDKLYMILYTVKICLFYHVIDSKESLTLTQQKLKYCLHNIFSTRKYNCPLVAQLVFRFLMLRIGCVYFRLMCEYQLSFKVMLVINGFYPAFADKAEIYWFARCVILPVTLHQDSVLKFLTICGYHGDLMILQIHFGLGLLWVYAPSGPLLLTL